MSDELAMCKSKRFSSSGRSISPVHRMRGFRWLLMLRKDDHDDNHGYDNDGKDCDDDITDGGDGGSDGTQETFAKASPPPLFGDLHLAYGADRGTLHR